MGIKTTFYSLVVFAWLLSINAIMVYPGKNISKGNCRGELDYFLCNCITSNTTIDIYLSRGTYHFKHQPFCSLQNKTSIKLIGHLCNDTVIECNYTAEPFNIVIMRVQSVIISNIKMVECGDVANDFINQTFYNATNTAGHFGSGFRRAIMLYQVKNIAIMH